jgi:hypothetical protein
MIVLVQMRDPVTERWDDMKVPRKRDAMPVKGLRPPVGTIDEFGEQLRAAQLVGEYRAFTVHGEVWRVAVERKDQYTVTITLETPEV